MVRRNCARLDLLATTLSLLLLAATSCATPPTGDPGSPPIPGIGIRDAGGEQEFYVRATGAAFTPRGHNYVKYTRVDDPIFGDASLDLVLSTERYDPVEARADLREMAARGFNVIRVMLETCAASGCISEPGDRLRTAYIDNVVSLLEIARDEGVYVWLTSNTLPDTGLYLDEAFGSGSDYEFLTPNVIDAYERYYRDLMQALVDRGAPFEALFSFSVRNEHWYDVRTYPWNAATGTFTAANGVTYDLTSEADKRRMAQDMVVYFADRTAAAVRSVLPDLLVSIGFFMPNEPILWRPGDFKLVLTERVLREANVDFFDLHSAPHPVGMNASDVAVQYGTRGVDKPLVMGEIVAFTWLWGNEAAAAQAVVDWQVASCPEGYDGWLTWHWEGDVVEGTYPGKGPYMADALSPALHPDPCAPVTIDNPLLTLGRPATASVEESPEYAAGKAVDGLMDTWWSAAAGPPQWLEVDLEAERSIRSIRIPIGWVTPAGDAHIRVLAKGDDAGDPWGLLTEFDTSIADGSVLEDTFGPPVEGIRRLRVEVEAMNGWVILHEVEAWGP